MCFGVARGQPILVGRSRAAIGVTPTISGGVVTAIFGLMSANTSATLTIAVQPTGHQ